MWCGRTSEKALVRLYRRWLTIFPACVNASVPYAHEHHSITPMCRGVGQLLDRGFRGIAKCYPNRMYSFYPAVVKDREKRAADLTHEQVVDSAEQAADRYTCEVVYRRVKVFDILHGHLPRKFLPYITAGWYVAHMFAQFYPPLRESVGCALRDKQLQDAIALAPLAQV